MGRFSFLVRAAARQLAAHPEIRKKATEIYEGEVKPRARSLYENEVKPRAQTAWREGKPKMEAARDEIRKDPKKFASRLKKRFFDRKRQG